MNGTGPSTGEGGAHTRPPEIVALTALRAFAAWWVVAYHFKAMTPTTAGLDWAILNHGWIGVDIFFALSGFVLSYVYDAELKDRTYSHRAFIIRRLARIYPMHIFTLGVVLLMALASMVVGADLAVQSNLQPQDGYNPAVTLVAQVFLVHAWGIDTVGHFNAPSWSISVEWFAYLLFPAFALIWLRWNIARAVVAAVVALVLVSVISTLAFDKPPANLLEQFGFLRIIPEFAFGMLAYRFYRGPGNGRAVIWLTIGGGLAAIDIALGLGYYTVPLAAALIVYGAAAIRGSGRVLQDRKSVV